MDNGTTQTLRDSLRQRQHFLNNTSANYLDNIHSSRNIMDNMLSIMASQERNMSTLLRNPHIGRSINNSNATTMRGEVDDTYRNYRRAPPVNFTDVPRNIIPGRNIHPPRRTRPRVATDIPNPTATQDLLENRITDIFRSLVQPGGALDNNIIQFDFYAPVSIIPTEQQITNATREVLFSSIAAPINNTCPISHDAIDPSDVVMQINHCGHIFTPRNLREWFSRSVRCPVCRFDIRDCSSNTTDISQNSAPQNSAPHNSAPQNSAPQNSAPQNSAQDASMNQTTMNNLVNIINTEFANYFENNQTDASENISIQYRYSPEGNNDIGQDLLINSRTTDQVPASPAQAPAQAPAPAPAPAPAQAPAPAPAPAQAPAQAPAPAPAPAQAPAPIFGPITRSDNILDNFTDSLSD